MSRAVYFEYKGKKYTASEIENTFGIKKATFLQRLFKGMSVEEAIETPVKVAPVYIYEGKKYRLTELAKATGLHKATIRRRIFVQGLTVEEAIQKKDYRERKRKTNVFFTDEEKEEKSELSKMDWDKFEKNFKSKPYFGDITRLTR